MDYLLLYDIQPKPKIYTKLWPEFKSSTININNYKLQMYVVCV